MKIRSGFVSNSSSSSFIVDFKNSKMPSFDNFTKLCNIKGKRFTAIDYDKHYNQIEKTAYLYPYLHFLWNKILVNKHTPDFKDEFLWELQKEHKDWDFDKVRRHVRESAKIKYDKLMSQGYASFVILNDWESIELTIMEKLIPLINESSDEIEITKFKFKGKEDEN